jgi:NAD+ kinase
VATVGFVVHTHREGAASLAADTARWLEELGHKAALLDTGAGGEGGEPDLDLAVSLGGDGTILRTVDLVSPRGIPVLGVNVGHLGYLSEVEPHDLRSALERFLSGAYQIESRLTLEVSVEHTGEDARGVFALRRSALNDLVLQRPPGTHTVHARVSVNGTPFLDFAADSLIVATPTGSTAYNLSARGPIVSPAARVIVLTPVAPHMLFDRSLVLDGGDELTLSPMGQPAELVVDGWHAATLHPGDLVHCRRGERDALLVRFGSHDFHRILKAKFNLADR